MNPNDPNTPAPQPTMPSVMTDAQKAAISIPMPQSVMPTDPLSQPQPGTLPTDSLSQPQPQSQPSQPIMPVQPAVPAPQPSEDQMAKAVNLVLDRAFRRMVQVLTDEDIKRIQELDKNDTTGETVRYFLLTKVPNMDAIINEEITILNKEAQSSSPSPTTP